MRKTKAHDVPKPLTPADTNRLRAARLEALADRVREATKKRYGYLHGKVSRMDADFTLTLEAVVVSLRAEAARLRGESPETEETP